MQSAKECCSNLDVKSAGKQALRLARRFMPVLSWAPTLTSRGVIADCTGGFIAGVMLVPTCLSWASLAGLNLSCGLSAALMASLSYGTFGSCAVLSIGPVAEITTLLISISGIDGAKREQTFQSIGVQVGILSVLLSFMDGGKVIKTIFAKPVGDGYTCAAALLAICVQLKTMFNVTAPAATLIQDVLYRTIKALIQQFSLNCIYSFILFMVYCLYLIYIKKTKLPLWVPHQLIVVVVSTLVTYYFGLYKESSLNLSIVGDIPVGLKEPDFPPWENMIGLGPYTLTITMISFVQMYVIAQRVMPDINPNGELFASGVTNFLCNVFGGMPVTNSFSISSVLLEQRVNTPLTAYAAATVLLITIVLLTRLGVFYYLPKQALGAIVVASVWRLVDFSGPMQLWQYSKKDAAVWVVTFVLTIFGGITVGVLGGIALSLILVVLRVARPRAVAVGFNMSTFHYGDISKDPELLVYPNILLWRFDAPLYFVNVGYFQEKLMKAIRDEVRPIDVVLVTCGKIVDIDAAALAALPTALESISKLDKDRQRKIILCDIHGRLEQVLLASEALPMYVPDEFDRLTVEQIEKTGKFPVVFKKLEDAIAFAQRCVSERYGNVDTAPYPNVSFLTDLVVEAARLQDADGGSALQAIAVHDDAGSGVLNEEDGSGDSSKNRGGTNCLIGGDGGGNSKDGNSFSPMPPLLPSITGGGNSGNRSNMNINLLIALEKLKKLSSFSPDRELIGVVGVIRHTELTPRQKEKILFTERRLIDHAFKNDSALRESKRTPEDLDDFLHTVDELLQAGQLHSAHSWHRVLTIVRSNPPGLKIKIKAQPIDTSKDGSFRSLDFRRQLQLEPHHTRDIQAARFVVKWGGVPTRSGIAQAHVLGEKLFARFYAAGDLPLRRLLAFTKRPRVCASDDSRVIRTALVVTNALTQSDPVTEEDIIFDDGLLKTLSPTAKRLLHDEYKYFEALMHIGSHAAARHYFHIPGFRQLLLIPPLDRPLLAGDNSLDGYEAVPNFFENPNLAPSLPQQQQQQRRQQLGGRGAEGGLEGDRSWDGMADALADEDPSVDPLGEPESASNRIDISFFHGSRSVAKHNTIAAVKRQQQPTLRNTDYYTPYEVMQELERNMRIVVETELPQSVLNLPLSNHETLHELRQRYRTMLKVFLGAKRKQNVSTREAVARRQQQRRGDGSLSPTARPSPHHSGSNIGNSISDKDDDDSEEDSKYDGEEAHGGNSAGPDSEDALEVVGGSSEDAREDSSDNSSNIEADMVMAEITSPMRDRADMQVDEEHEEHFGPQDNVPPSPPLPPRSQPREEEEEGQEQQRQPVGGHGAGDLLHQDSTGVFSGSDTTHPFSSRTCRRGEGHKRRVTAAAPTPTPLSQQQQQQQQQKAREEAKQQQEQHRNFFASSPSSQSPSHHSMNDGARPPLPPNFAPRLRLGVLGRAHYDLSDISKLRDFGSYDLSYNIGLLKGLHTITRMPEVRRLCDALMRTARITECMSRVGENVLEGVNSSKRFIIGSLVSGRLLGSIYKDYKDFAKMDERKGVRELLVRAQSLYMAERGGMEQDVRHVMSMFRRLGKKRTTGSAAALLDPLRGDEPYQDETPAEREFRLRFPFISLPKEEPLPSAAQPTGAAPKKLPTGKRAMKERRKGRDSGDEDEEFSSARFYFTTYLHVEGTLQCLFESVTVEGFSRPSREELEESQQLYMKHLIFKVFRRRNYSFTDAEALAAFRRLNLLFRSEVDYGRQQRELRAGLANIYHSMYYISMEVYLSLGDAEGIGGSEALDGPLLYLDDNAVYDGSSANVSPDGGTDMFMSGEDDRLGGAGSNASRRGGGGGAGGGISSWSAHSEYEDFDESELDLAHTTPGIPQAAALSSPPRSQRQTSSIRRFSSGDMLPTISVTAPSPNVAQPTSLSSGSPRDGGASNGSVAHPNPSFLSPAAIANMSSSFLASRPTGTSTIMDSPLSRNGVAFSASSGAAVALAAAAVAAGDTAAGLPRQPTATTTAHSSVDGGGAGASVTVAMAAEPSFASQRPPPKKARRHHNHNEAKKTATVLTTPQAGRGTAVVQEMKNRVSSVTPMRRIHEGMSIDDFLRLIKEAESAILSQKVDS